VPQTLSLQKMKLGCRSKLRLSSVDNEHGEQRQSLRLPIAGDRFLLAKSNSSNERKNWVSADEGIC
jgi:hypothetical protein